MIDNTLVDTEFDVQYERKEIEFDALVESMHAPATLPEIALAFADFRDSQQREWR